MASIISNSKIFIFFFFFFFLSLSMVSESVTNGNLAAQETNAIDLLHTFSIKSLSQMHKVVEVARDHIIKINGLDDNHQSSTLVDCLELTDMSMDRLADTLPALANLGTLQSNPSAHTWLSGVLTNLVTCFDEVQTLGSDHEQPATMKVLLKNLISRTRASLAVLANLAVPPAVSDVVQPLNGKLPEWISMRDRKLLGEISVSGMRANVVVAQDGSGDYRRIQEAVDSAPDKSKTRYVIRVKKGTYNENVEVGKNKRNVMIVGDGMDLSIITASRNVADGSTTFQCATLAVAGDGFIIQDMWIQNTAGPEKQQAVALRVSGDQSVINRCRIDAYQDTLYAHNYRQFYRDCIITGTVDFIFGNAAVVLQNCKIIARKPMRHQMNMVTAQGRMDANQNTGTSIQNCKIIASHELESVQESFPTYLGRPWKEFSRTVVMQSYIGGHVNPAGWAEWKGDFALKSLYYGEYANHGPGAGTSKRVKWPGFAVITDPDVAKSFTVAGLIQGGAWLGSTGVNYTEGF